MKQTFRLFQLFIKRWFRTIPLLILLAVFPLFFLLLHSISMGSDGNSLTVLLYCEAPDQTTERIFEDLSAACKQAEFCIAESESQLKTEVARGTAECGYIFPENFARLVKESDWESSILLYTSSSSMMYTLTRELVFGAILHETAPMLAESFFIKNHRYAQALEKILETYPLVYQQQQTQGDLVALESRLVTNVGGTEVPVKTAYTIPVRGLCGVLLFVMSLFASGIYLLDRQRGLYQSMPSRTKRFAPWCTILSLLILCCIPVWISLLLCKESLPGVTGILLELAAMACYLVLLTGFSSLLAHVLQKPERIFTLIPLLTIGALAVCPVFIDLSHVILALSWLEKCFPPYYYLAECFQSHAYLPLTLLLGGILLFLDQVVLGDKLEDSYGK